MQPSQTCNKFFIVTYTNIGSFWLHFTCSTSTFCLHWGFRKSGLIEICYHLAIYASSYWLEKILRSVGRQLGKILLWYMLCSLKNHWNLRGLTQITTIPGRTLNLSFLWLCHAGRVTGSLGAKCKLLLYWNGNLLQRKFIFYSGWKAHLRIVFNTELTEPMSVK